MELALELGERLLRQLRDVGVGHLAVGAVGHRAEFARVDEQRLAAPVAYEHPPGAVIWAFRRFTRPWLGWHESLVDMALLVERQAIGASAS